MMKARTSRSDAGIRALANSIFKNILGLNDETASRLLKIIRNQGQWQDLMVNVRTLSGIAHRRLNDVINMAQDKDMDIDPSDEFYDENGAEDEDGVEDIASPWGDDMPAEAMTFAGFLLTELQYTDQDLRDPMRKQEILRIIRAGDDQAAQLKTRGERDQKQDQRQEIQQEKDPQRINLLRTRQQLQRRIAQINQKLGEPGADEAV